MAFEFRRERRKGGKSRKSYVVWEETETVPRFALKLFPGHRVESMTKGRHLHSVGGFLLRDLQPEYWRRDGHQPFEVYKLVNGVYQLQIGEPYWMLESGNRVTRPFWSRATRGIGMV